MIRALEIVVSVDGPSLRVPQHAVVIEIPTRAPQVGEVLLHMRIAPVLIVGDQARAGIGLQLDIHRFGTRIGFFVMAKAGRVGVADDDQLFMGSGSMPAERATAAMPSSSPRCAMRRWFCSISAFSSRSCWARNSHSGQVRPRTSTLARSEEHTSELQS